MALALCALSHSPLFGINDPGQPTLGEVHGGIAAAKAFAQDFDPDLVVVFGPDHFNGVFYDMMPAFCIGSAATSVGDWGTHAGPLPVDQAAARTLAASVLDAGIDVAQSERLMVDHGIVQPLEFLFGAPSVPIIPVFLNAVGLPLGPMQRVRLLGEAVGREVASWNRRVLVVASGGLSHDPPVPRLADATPEVAERLIDGRNPSAEARRLRQERVIQAGIRHAQGARAHQPVNPDFDRLAMDLLATGQLAAFDGWSNAWMEQEGGHSAHEIRTWVAAYAALSVQGAYDVRHRFYWPVDEWMTGFGIMTAAGRS